MPLLASLHRIERVADRPTGATRKGAASAARDYATRIDRRLGASLVTEVNGVATRFDGLRDTFSVPPMKDGKPGAAKLIIPFTTPEIVGRFVFHCHVAKHEDKGMGD